MSNVGQAALIVVGTVVGAYFGYPQLGFVLGSLAGSALFPTQLPPGPKISDNRTTTSAVGGPVSIVFGTAALSGTVIDLGPVIQTSHEQGGKGGPEQQTFTYTQTIAIGLCERVDDTADDTVGAIGGMSRVWENGQIVYDIRPQLPGDTALGTIAETDEQYANRLVASAAYAETFVLYLGDELQEADPTLQVLHGVDLTPPFRGLAYVVFPNRSLTIAQGLRHPNFQFEVFQQGVGDCVDTPMTSTEVLYPWNGGSSSNPINTSNANSFAIDDFDARWPLWSSPSLWDTTVDSEDDILAMLGQAGGYPSPMFTGYVASGGELTQANGIFLANAIGQPNDPIGVQINYSSLLPNSGYWTDTQRLAGIPVAHTPNVIWHEGIGAPGGDTVFNTGDFGPVQPPDDRFPPATYGKDATGGWQMSVQDAWVSCTRSPSAPTPPCAGLVPSPIAGYSLTSDGHLIKCNDWVRIADPGSTVKVLQRYGASGGAHSGPLYPLNPCLILGDPNYANATFWTNAYNDAVSRGWMPAGKTYGVDYPQSQNFYYSVDQVICVGSGNQVSIASVIEAICKRAGLLAIDVKDLADIFINGYAISSVCTGSSVITPLRSIGFFDCVETGGFIKFATRGKDSVATFTTDDFGCYDASQGIDGQDNTDSTGASNCPPSITTSRSQDEDLPRSIRFHYVSTARDYEDGEQDSDFRLATAATNDVDITVPVCLDDTQALQCAQVLWADSWSARSAYELSIDQSWLILDVADAIEVPVDGFIKRMRIANDTNASAVLRKLSLVRDDSDSFVSFAVAAAPQRVPQQLTFIGPTMYELMDLPCLQDADSDPGFYIAAQRLNGQGNGWKGATMYKSIDGGVSFTQAFSLLTEAVIGSIDSSVPASQTYTWDDETIITVDVPTSAYTFESVTDDAVLAGANASAMGNDGRWEIVQFANATQITATQWQLSRLLRGRRGTEYVLGKSVPGDQFVMVSTGDLGRLVLQTTEIGAMRIYKGVSIGASFSSGTDESFAGHGQALVCFSPVNAAAERITDRDILITWVRRSRLGRTLMSGVDIPLGETVEAYSIDILETGSPHTVLRTLTASTNSVLYSHADQVADFGSPGPSSLDVAIYQLSSVVGRGTPFLGTLTVTEV